MKLKGKVKLSLCLTKYEYYPWRRVGGVEL